MTVMLKEFIREKTRKDDKKKGRPVGCFVGTKLEANEESIVLITTSRYNTKKETKPFSKQVAYEIALGKNLKYKEQILDNKFDISKNKYNSSINGIEKFIDRCKKYFKTNKVICIS